MKKIFVVDTNVLIDNPDAVKILRNGVENKETNIIWIPRTVIEELDKLKRKDNVKHIVKKVIDNLNEYPDYYTILNKQRTSWNVEGNPDNVILAEICAEDTREAILVTNDRLLQLKARNLGIEVQEFRESIPFESESELYTGFVDKSLEYKIPNSFYFNDTNYLVYNSNLGEKEIRYENKIWNTSPKHYTQNCAMELLLDETVDLVSIQSSAGKGKTHLAVAAALRAVLEKKTHRKIYVFKTVEEIGPSIGFLPGTMNEKLEPYIKYIKSMFFKLHDKRKGNNKVFLNESELNPEFIEILPLTFIRGMNIDNSFVIVDEAQNISKLQMRALLTRMGENVKCVILGDTNQVDNLNLNQQNNGLNWVVKLFTGERKYGHIVLGGDKSRGPICDMVLRNGL
jgi:PhoH-like ATPase